MTTPMQEQAYSTWGGLCCGAGRPFFFLQGNSAMSTFEIEQYELHTQKYRVEAANEAEAIKNLFAGEGEAVDGGLEYIELAEEFGLPADLHRELADALRADSITVMEVIPSIRSIERV
jgi:hypothetical protein